jgi:hypothetical protein
MIKPQHDSQGKKSPDPCKRRGRQQDQLDNQQECYEVLGARIYGKKHGLDRVCATRHQQQIFFDTTSAQGDLGWSSGQIVVVYKLCKCKFKGKTLKGQKIPTQACDLIFFSFTC